VTDLAGTRQIITQSQHNIVGVSAATGELLWRIPFSTPYEQNIVTPALYHDTLLFSGLGNGVMGVRVLKRGSEWVTETIWQNKDVGMYMSSPVVSGDLMFGLSNLKHGQFFCLDARNGATLWTSEGRQADNAAVIDGGSVLFLLTNDAELIVARKTVKGFEPLRKYSVADSPTWAHPVVLNNGILIKDLSTLALWGTD
jgi:outer membrane protein assembly factor BamB